jgi:hypothetical protein
MGATAGQVSFRTTVHRGVLEGMGWPTNVQYRASSQAVWCRFRAGGPDQQEKGLRFTPCSGTGEQAYHKAVGTVGTSRDFHPVHSPDSRPGFPGGWEHWVYWEHWGRGCAVAAELER